MKKIKPQPQEIFIHIKAESKYLSVSEILPEKKAVARLVDIRDNFTYMKKRFDEKGEEKLAVSTCVHNPKLF